MGPVVHDEIASTKRKIGETVQGTEAEELYQEIIGNPKGWMDSIAMQLDAIVNIWQTVSSRCNVPEEEGTHLRRCR